MGIGMTLPGFIATPYAMGCVFEFESGYKQLLIRFLLFKIIARIKCRIKLQTYFFNYDFLFVLFLRFFPEFVRSGERVFNILLLLYLGLRFDVSDQFLEE